MHLPRRGPVENLPSTSHFGDFPVKILDMSTNLTLVLNQLEQERSLHRRLFRVPDEYLLHASPVCFVVELLCGTQRCRSAIRVYLLAYKGEDKRVVLGQFRDATFRITCPEGHTPHFDFANLIRVDSIGPFAPW